MSEEAPKTEPAAEQQPAEDTPQETVEAQPEQPASEEQQQEEATPKTEEETPAGEDAAKPEGEGDTAPAEGETAAAEEAPPEQQQQEEEEEEEDDEEPEDDVPIALVTGASGYVATHLVKQLLEQGRFRIRGTVRDKKREDKVKPLKDLVPDAKYPLRLVNANLEKPDSWAKAVKRCSYVFHVASPFPLKNPKREEDIIRPAVEGAKNVLKACAEAGTVKRVVLTSSIAAVAGLGGHPGSPPDRVYTEKDWIEEAGISPYDKSKLKAERAAWDFVKELGEDKRFELVVVNPGYVQGPFLSKVSGESSASLLAPTLTGSSPADVSFALVDVRDVAAAHIAAMEKPEAAGNRYLIVNETMHMVDISKIVAAEFKPQGYKVSVKQIGKTTLFVGKFFNARAKQAYSLLGKRVLFNNERMKGELGIEPRPINETLLDTCYSLVEIGLVKRTRGYLGHPSTRPEPAPEPEPEPAAAAAAAPETTAEEPPKEQTEGDKPEDAATTEEPKQGDAPATTEEPTTTEQATEEDKPATEEPKEEAKEDDTPASETPAEKEDATPTADDSQAPAEEEPSTQQQEEQTADQTEPAPAETTEEGGSGEPAAAEEGGEQ